MFTPSTPSAAAIVPPHGEEPAIRLLQVVGGDASGVTGVERVAQTLVAGLDTGRFVHFVAYPAAGKLYGWFHARVRGVLPDLPQHRFDPGWVRRLVRFLRDRSIDVVLSHGMRYDFLCALACRRAGVPHLVSRPAPLVDEATMRPWRKLLYGAVDTWTLHACAGIVTVSTASQARMLSTQRLPQRRITIIPNGVRLPEVDAAGRAAARRELGVPADAFVIGGAGRLVPGKCFDRLVRVARRLRPPPGRELALVLLGDGPERDSLARQAGANDVRLILPGFVESAAVLLASFDVAVLPSRAEGLPLVVLESMALAVPTVATAVGGIPEVIVDGESGLLVPADDDAALAGALQDLIDSAALRARLGAAAARRIREHFALETMLERFAALLRRTCAAASARGGSVAP